MKLKDIKWSAIKDMVKEILMGLLLVVLFAPFALFLLRAAVLACRGLLK